MVIEHSFVTTLEANETMSIASMFLSSHGFANNQPHAFGVGDAVWNHLEMTRGKKNAARAKNIAELPQTVRIDWDRGRVSVALGITPSGEWGGGSGSVAPVLAFGLLGALAARSWSSSGNPKKMVLHQQMLTAIATGLEQLLAERASPEQAWASWEQTEAQIKEVARKRSRRNLIVLFCILGIFGLVITLAVLSSVYRW